MKATATDKQQVKQETMAKRVSKMEYDGILRRRIDGMLSMFSKYYYYHIFYIYINVY